ncbi:universal stress protein [Natrialbaceae archaeon A-CW3]
MPTILVPHDGSSNAQDALTYALETFPDATIVLFHAIDPFEVTPDEESLPPLTDEWLEGQHAEANALFERALESVDDHIQERIETATAVGSPAQSIVGYLEDAGVDQLVMGRRGRGKAPHAQMGSTAEIVIKRASVPVTVVR